MYYVTLTHTEASTYVLWTIGTLPWKVAFTPPTKVYDLQISVTDTLQLNDTAQLEHTGCPLHWSVHMPVLCGFSVIQLVP